MAEFIQRMDEELIQVNIGGRILELREMKIKRTRMLGELLFRLQGTIAEFFKGPDGKDLPPDQTISPEFNKAVDQAILDILNFLFNLSGEKALTIDWVEDNLSIRQIEAIVKEAVSQSKIDWMLPFFDPYFRHASGLRVPPQKVPVSQSGNGIT